MVCWESHTVTIASQRLATHERGVSDRPEVLRPKRAVWNAGRSAKPREARGHHRRLREASGCTSCPAVAWSGAAHRPALALRGRLDNAAKFSSIARISPHVSP